MVPFGIRVGPAGDQRVPPRTLLEDPATAPNERSVLVIDEHGDRKWGGGCRGHRRRRRCGWRHHKGRRGGLLHGLLDGLGSLRVFHDLNAASNSLSSLTTRSSESATGVWARAGADARIRASTITTISLRKSYSPFF